MTSARFRPTRLKQALKASREAGLTVAETVVEPNGRVRVIYTDGAALAVDSTARDEGLIIEQAMADAFGAPAGSSTSSSTNGRADQ